MIVGVTNEAEGLVKKWIEEKKAKYAIALVAGNDTDKAYDVKGFPSGALVDADGKVVWIGHPASLGESQVEEELKKVYFVPPLPAKYSSINAEVARKNFGKAHAAIEKEIAKEANELLVKAKEAIEKMADARLASAKTKGEAGDYSAGVAILDEASRLFKGMPAADDAAKQAKEWRADKAVKAQIKAGDDLRKAEGLEKLNDLAARKRAYQIYLEIARKMKGTPLGEKAQAGADRIKPSL